MHKSIPSAHKTTLNSISPEQNYWKQVFLCEPMKLFCIIKNIKAAASESAEDLSMNSFKKIIIDTDFQSN